jgi:hypothetical protein
MRAIVMTTKFSSFAEDVNVRSLQSWYGGYQQQQTTVFGRCPPTYELQYVYRGGLAYPVCSCPQGTYQAWVYGQTMCYPQQKVCDE